MRNVDGTTRQSIDLIFYFFSMMKLMSDTDLQNLSAEDIESFTHLAYYIEKKKKKKSVYFDISDYNGLTSQEKKHAVIIKVDDLKINFSPIKRTKFFMPFHLHMKRSRNSKKFKVYRSKNFFEAKSTWLF